MNGKRIFKSIQLVGLALVLTGSPRSQVPASTDGEARSSTASYLLTARLLGPGEVARQFVSDVGRKYAVIEVSLAPAVKGFEVRRSDFQISLPGTKEPISAVEPAAVAAYLQKTAPVYRDITITPEVGVGYQTGSPSGRNPTADPTIDPNYAPYPPAGGVTVRTAVGVRFGENTVGATDQDRKVMEAELSDKGLPEGAASSRIVGHLYFQVDHPAKLDRLQLSYTPAGKPHTEIELTLN